MHKQLKKNDYIVYYKHWKHKNKSELKILIKTIIDSKKWC